MFNTPYFSKEKFVLIRVIRGVILINLDLKGKFVLIRVIRGVFFNKFEIRVTS